MESIERKRREMKKQEKEIDALSEMHHLLAGEV